MEYAARLGIKSQRGGTYLQNVVDCGIEKDSNLLLILYFDKLITVDIYLQDQLKILLQSVSDYNGLCHIFYSINLQLVRVNEHPPLQHFVIIVINFKICVNFLGPFNYPYNLVLIK